MTATATCTPTPSDFLYLPLTREGTVRLKQLVAGMVILFGVGALIVWLRELWRK